MIFPSRFVFLYSERRPQGATQEVDPKKPKNLEMVARENALNEAQYRELIDENVVGIQETMQEMINVFQRTKDALRKDLEESAIPEERIKQMEEAVDKAAQAYQVEVAQNQAESGRITRQTLKELAQLTGVEINTKNPFSEEMEHHEGLPGKFEELKGNKEAILNALEAFTQSVEQKSGKLLTLRELKTFVEKHESMNYAAPLNEVGARKIAEYYTGPNYLGSAYYQEAPKTLQDQYRGEALERLGDNLTIQDNSDRWGDTASEGDIKYWFKEETTPTKDNQAKSDEEDIKLKHVAKDKDGYFRTQPIESFAQWNEKVFQTKVGSTIEQYKERLFAYYKSAEQWEKKATEMAKVLGEADFDKRYTTSLHRPLKHLFQKALGSEGSQTLYLDDLTPIQTSKTAIEHMQETWMGEFKEKAKTKLSVQTPLLVELNQEEFKTRGEALLKSIEGATTPDQLTVTLEKITDWESDIAREKQHQDEVKAIKAQQEAEVQKLVAAQVAEAQAVAKKAQEAAEAEKKSAEAEKVKAEKATKAAEAREEAARKKMEEAGQAKESDKDQPDQSEKDGEKTKKKTKVSGAGREASEQEASSRDAEREDKLEPRAEVSRESLREKRSIEITKAENLDGYVKKFLKDNLGSEKVDEALVASAVMVVDKHLVNESGRPLVVKQGENIFTAVDQKIKKGEKIYISGTIFEAAQARAKKEGGKDILSVQQQKETFQKGPAQAASAPNAPQETSVSPSGRAGENREVTLKRTNQERKVEAAEIRNQAALELLPPNVAITRKLNLINHLQDQYGIGRQRNLRYFLHTNYRNAQEFLQTMESAEGKSRKAKRNAIQNILGVKNFLGLGDVGQAERYAAAMKDIEGRMQVLRTSGFKFDTGWLEQLSMENVLDVIVQAEEWQSREDLKGKTVYYSDRFSSDQEGQPIRKATKSPFIEYRPGEDQLPQPGNLLGDILKQESGQA